MIDLHMHTTNSDGTDTTLEVIDKCEKLKLEYISITDHDTCKSYSDIKNSKINKIFSGKKNGSREKLLWLAFGFPLTLEETRQLLRAGGYSELSPKNKRDALVIYALDSGYTIQEVNKLLLENEEDVFA